MSTARAILLVLALDAAACAHPQPVELSEAWPSQPGDADDYEEITERWTRHGHDHADTQGSLVVEETIDVVATFKSPEWRAAQVARMAEQHDLPRSQVNAMLEKAKADAAEHYEVELLVSTYDRRANDLQKGERSTWRVVLVDDAGVEIPVTHIKRDRRPRSEIKADFPRLGDFDVAYVAQFPRSVDLLRPEARRVSLKVTSSQGAVTLVWSE